MSTEEIFESNKKKIKMSVSQTIAEEIATLIGKRILHPGEHLVENVLVERFNVSRSSIREALSILEGDNLVERIPYHGVKVRNFSTKEIHDLYDTIYGLEWLAMDKAVEKVIEDQVTTLENILRQQESAIENKEVEKYYNLNEDFHQYIFMIADNSILLDMYNHLHRMVRPFRLLTLAQGDNMVFSYEEHFEQKEALKNKDIESANLAIKEQKDRSLESLKIIFPEEN